MNKIKDINYTEVYKRIIILLEHQNKSFSDLKEYGVNPQVLTRLSAGSSTSADKLFQIAKYLDTTCEFLLTGEDKNNNIQTSSEQSFMYFFRHLPSDYKLPIKMLTQTMYETAKRTNRLVKNELEDIARQLQIFNTHANCEISDFTRDELLAFIRTEKNKKNENFEEFLRINFETIKSKKNVTEKFEIEDFLESL